jgi:hypothetical protein
MSGAWLAVGAAVVVIALGGVCVWSLAERRARRTVEGLQSELGMLGGPGARLLLATAACAFAIAVTNAAVVIIARAL